ncbi:MAG: MFS transporter [Bacillota bacterium]
MDRKHIVELTALSGVPFTMVLGNSMLIPILPDLQRALDISSLQASLVITLFSVPASLIIPVSGFLSDHFSRKIVIGPSLLLYGLGGLVAGIAALLGGAATYVIILTGRILQGLGAAGTAPIAMALTSDLFQGQKRTKALGVIEAANGFGKVMSPILGAALGLLAWFAPFLFFPVITLAAAAALWFGVKEPQQTKKPQPVGKYLESLTKLFKKKTALLLLSYLAGSLALMTLFGILFFLSEHLEKRYGLEGIVKGLALAIPVLFMSATAYATGFLIKRKAKLMKAVLIAGLAVGSASLAVLPLCNNTYFFFTTISLIGIGTGMVLPILNTIITSSTDAEERGLVTSLYGSVRFLGVAAGPPVFSLLLQSGLKPMGWIPAGVTAATAVLSFFLIKSKDISQG